MGHRADLAVRVLDHPDAAGAQRVDEPRQAGNAAEFLRDRRAVEVGAERDAVDADPLDQVVDVADDLVERRLDGRVAVRP